MKQDVDRKFRKLSLKISYLREELYDLEEEFDRRGWQLNRAVLELLARSGDLASKIHNANPQAQKDEQTQPEQESTSNPNSSWQRKVFRKISSKTHPDALLREELSEREKIERTKMFHDAARALQNGDGGRLLEIATELDLNVDEAPIDEHIASMERLAGELETRMQEIKRTAAWIWGAGPRRPILAHVAKASGWSGSPDSLLDDILAWVDAGFVGGLETYALPAPPDTRRMRPSRKIGQRPEKRLGNR